MGKTLIRKLQKKLRKLKEIGYFTKERTDGWGNTLLADSSSNRILTEDTIGNIVYGGLGDDYISGWGGSWVSSATNSHGTKVAPPILLGGQGNDTYKLSSQNTFVMVGDFSGGIDTVDFDVRESSLEYIWLRNKRDILVKYDSEYADLPYAAILFDPFGKESQNNIIENFIFNKEGFSAGGDNYTIDNATFEDIVNGSNPYSTSYQSHFDYVLNSGPFPVTWEGEKLLTLNRDNPEILDEEKGRTIFELDDKSVKKMIKKVKKNERVLSKNADLIDEVASLVNHDTFLFDANCSNNDWSAWTPDSISIYQGNMCQLDWNS